MRHFGITILGGLSMILLAACVSATETPSPTATSTRPVRLFDTPTPSPTQVISSPAVAATQTPLPSPTPFTYTIAAGDTLLAIAFRFGVTVDELLKVNPGIDPGFLTIGADLVIPIGESGSAFLPTPTPVPLSFSDPECHLTADRSLWCFMTVRNENNFGLEGVNGWIDLYNEQGELVATQDATTPLNIVPAGGSLPLASYFPGNFEPGYFGLGYIRGAFLANNLEGRYLDHSVLVEEIAIAEDLSQATIIGEARISGDSGEEPADVTISVVAIAYGPGGTIVGLRRWEWLGTLAVGDSIPFETTVYSLGPGVERVEVYSEIRPAYQPDGEE